MAERPGLRNCIACLHPSAAHEPGGERPCRVNDCGCQGFAPERADTSERTAEPEGRVVMLTIPDGYEMTVTFRPTLATGGTIDPQVRFDIVGETGPEVLVPNVPGHILPHPGNT